MSPFSRWDGSGSCCPKCQSRALGFLLARTTSQDVRQMELETSVLVLPCSSMQNSGQLLAPR